LTLCGTTSAGDRDNVSDGPVAEDSKSTDVGARYAQALFDLAKQTGRLAAVETDLKAFKAMRAESLDLRRMLASPAFSAEAKGRALAALAEKARFDPMTRKFFGLVAANRRASLIPSAITAFEALSAADRGVIAAEVTTAVKLTPAQETGLKAALRQALGKVPEIETRVDASILGGLKVRVGSRLYDASLRSKLDSLRFALKRA
jgi:F-type H+-transporting ATPase subunit delta